MNILDGLGKYDIQQLRKGRLTLRAYSAAMQIATARWEASSGGVTPDRLVVDAINEMGSAARREPDVPCQKCHTLGLMIDNLVKVARSES